MNKKYLGNSKNYRCKISKEEQSSSVVDKNGKMYVFGSNDLSTNVNSMDILDTINLSLSKGSDFGAPPPRTMYSATLLADIGVRIDPRNGIFSVSYVQLSSVSIKLWYIKKKKLF